MKKICLIYNYAHHYRTNIFTLMDKELPIYFYFGDKYLDVKKMDYSLLNNFRKEVRNLTFIFKPIYFQVGVLKLLFNRDYKLFLMLGESIFEEFNLVDIRNDEVCFECNAGYPY